MKSDINKENDIMSRKGLSAIHSDKKIKSAKKEELSKEGKKEELMDWLFGKSDKNPLENIK